MSEEQNLVAALWIFHAHCVGHFEQTPYLSVTSPERQCGKSRLLELLHEIVPRPWMAVTPSDAVVYRYIDAVMPTLLLDEVDTIFNERTADRYEGLRAILNAGHRRGAQVPRCVGPSQELKAFNVFCAKVLAGIGTLPDTVADRVIPIRLQRRTREERVARFRRREVEKEAGPLRARIETWAEARGASMAAARPELPEELSDRMQEGCEPLLAIADELGAGTEAREALTSLLARERQDSTETRRVKLLRDLQSIFLNDEPARAALRTETLLGWLNAAEGYGWSGEWFGRDLDARAVASLLKPYGISPKSVREGEAPVAKGYHRDQFADAWARYVTDVTPVTQDGEAQ